MNNDKNLNSNNGTVDEELLRGFFADSEIGRASCRERV